MWNATARTTMLATFIKAKSSILSLVSKRYLLILAWVVTVSYTSAMSSHTTLSKAATILMKSCARNALKRPVEAATLVIAHRPKVAFVHEINRRFRNSSSAATKFWFKLSKKESAIKGQRYRHTSVSPADERRRLKDILYDLDPPKGLGFIVRTAGAGKSREALARAFKRH